MQGLISGSFVCFIFTLPKVNACGCYDTKRDRILASTAEARLDREYVTLCMFRWVTWVPASSYSYTIEYMCTVYAISFGYCTRSLVLALYFISLKVAEKMPKIYW